MQQFKLSEALKTIYSLIWDDFCSWYLEWVKPGFEQPIHAEVYEKTVGYFEQLLHLLHPFMPFISEEIFHLLRPQTEDICTRQHAPIPAIDTQMVASGELLKQLISALRDARNKNQLKPKITVHLHIQTSRENQYQAIRSILAKQINASEVSFTQQQIAKSIVVAVEKDRFYLESAEFQETGTQRETLLKDLAHQKQFLEQVSRKLQNEKFVQNAKPEVIALERKKEADALARIQTIEATLSQMDSE
jgi:valyl-tRNA synthetase